MLQLRSSPAAPYQGHGWLVLLRIVLVTMMATWAAGCASLPANVSRPVTHAFNAPDDTALGRLVQQRRAQAGVTRSDSGFRLLDSVDIAFTSRLALIEGAQRSLDLQYYAIHADSSTAQLLERIKAAAARGVRVRILLDDFNSVGADAQVLRLAFLKNIELRLYNPLPGSRRSMLGRIFTSLHDVGQMQKRMHNKLFIADNAWGITGGRNLGDAYFGRGEESNFVDLDVLAAGRIVRDMSASFDIYWNNDLAYPVQALLDKEDLDRLRKPLAASTTDVSQAPADTAPAVTVTHSTSVLPDVTSTGVQTTSQSRALNLQQVALIWAPSVLMVDKPGKVGPGDDEVDAGDTLIDGLLTLMAQARSDVLIVSPYFVPGQPMMKAFQELRQRGIRIRVLTNSLASNDAPAAHAGYARYRKRLLEAGVELYEMRAEQDGSAGALGSGGGTRGAQSGGMFGSGAGVGGSKAGSGSRASLHSKAVIIDGRLAVIGSMNLDLRSQLKNSEVALVIRSAALSTQAIRLVENSIAKAAYRLQLAGNSLRWRAPPGASFPDATSEPEAGTRLKLLVNVLGPLAPDEML